MHLGEIRLQDIGAGIDKGAAGKRREILKVGAIGKQRIARRASLSR